MDNLQSQIGFKTAKDFNTKPIQTSVVNHPSGPNEGRPRGRVVFQVAGAADAIPQWGTDMKARDLHLRSFWKSEPYLASAVGSMVLKLGATEWEVKAADPTKKTPKNTINAVTRMLKNSHFYKGWQNFFSRWLVDLYTQDNGAFIEVVRKNNNDPRSPVIMLNHLDSYSCYRTGDPETPVLYFDSNGKVHELKWWQVAPLEELPMPDETMYGMQLCVVSRCLRAAQILRDIEIYKHEKVSGQFSRGIHLVSGVTMDVIEDAMGHMEEEQLNRMLVRYSQPAILPTIDPEHRLSHVKIDLATLPDAFNEDSTFRQYIAQLALAFGVDYQEFAPLPGGNLGSSAQSDILDKKTRGKGPAAILTLFEDWINNSGVIPSNVVFSFIYNDERKSSEEAVARFERGKDRSLRVKSGELTREAAVRMAVEDGDLPEYLAEQILKEIEENKRRMQEQFNRQPPEDDGTSDNTMPNMPNNSVVPNGIDVGNIEGGSNSQELRAPSDRMRISKNKVFSRLLDEWYLSGKIDEETYPQISFAITVEPDLLEKGFSDEVKSGYPIVEELYQTFLERMLSVTSS